MLIEDQNTTIPDDLDDDANVTTTQDDDPTDRVEDISESDEDAEVDTGEYSGKTLPPITEQILPLIPLKVSRMWIS